MVREISIETLLGLVRGLDHTAAQRNLRIALQELQLVNDQRPSFSQARDQLGLVRDALEAVIRVNFEDNEHRPHVLHRLATPLMERDLPALKAALWEHRHTLYRFGSGTRTFFYPYSSRLERNRDTYEGPMVDHIEQLAHHYIDREGRPPANHRKLVQEGLETVQDLLQAIVTPPKRVEAVPNHFPRGEIAELTHLESVPASVDEGETRALDETQTKARAIETQQQAWHALQEMELWARQLKLAPALDRGNVDRRNAWLQNAILHIASVRERLQRKDRHVHLRRAMRDGHYALKALLIAAGWHKGKVSQDIRYNNNLQTVAESLGLEQIPVPHYLRMMHYLTIYPYPYFEVRGHTELRGVISRGESFLQGDIQENASIKTLVPGESRFFLPTIWLMRETLRLAFPVETRWC